MNYILVYEKKGLRYCEFIKNTSAMRMNNTITCD